MAKIDWLHLFQVFHIIGMVMILTLPISALMLLKELGGRDFRIVAPLGVFLGQMDRIAQVGSLLVLLTGIGQMWADGITVHSLSGANLWLGAKITLFALLVINGAITAGPAIRSRVRLLQKIALQGSPTPDQEEELVRSANFMRITGIPQMIILLAILFLVSFAYPFHLHRG